MAGEMGCSLSGIRRYLDELIAAGLIAERLAGTRRAKVYVRIPIRQNRCIEDSVNASWVTDCGPSNTSKPEVQYVKTDDSNTSETTYSYKKTPEEKKKEENVVPELPGTVVVVGADRATAAADEKQKSVKVAFGSLSDDARSVVDDWRSKQGKTRPPKLNPTQAAYLEDAVSDLGSDRLFEANTWAAQNGVPEFVKAIRAARTKRQRDEEDGPLPPAPHVNGSASTLTPATDDDRAIWGRALGVLGGVMTRTNVEAYLAPLEVAGRGEDGGLWLVVNPATAEHTAKFKHHISRALEDAGDRNPTAVCFKARKARGQPNGEA
jgi:hypothetical protein